NTTLQVLIRQSEQDKKEMEERFASNIMTLVLPYVEKIKKGQLDSIQRFYLDVLEANLNEILSPFLSRLSHIKLTPKEKQISNLIREGKTIKEISEITGISKGTVIAHRNNIRKKLNLKRKRINLQSYLQSIE
ncbi:MAG: helix-turn-helix transcriptional regulator, partial [Syntrophorhabdaceae bacterium]|nr:helix-turn-helix transcriptional regulator [Syntrophorhabdaceae bacterium]